MKYGLWILQALLAFAFLAAGGMKLVMPIETLEAQMGFVSYTPEFLVRFIGLAELTGAVGLIVPAALRIKPWLTPLAAGGLGLVMVLAVGLHISRAEWAQVGPPIVLLVLLGMVAYGRTKVLPISERKEEAGEERETRYASESAHAH